MTKRSVRRVLSASRRQRSRRLFTERFEERLLLSTFTVNSTDDSGPGTLRQAILDSNASPAAAGQSNHIDFEIGTGAQVIEPASALPTVTATVAIDATVSKIADQTVEIRGDQAGSGVDGLTIEAMGVVIAGLTIDEFDGSGVRIEGGGGSRIEASTLGSSPTSGQNGNGGDGVTIDGSNGNSIGGFASTGMNVISGNGGSGVAIQGGASGNLIEDDSIGVGADGLTFDPNDENGVTIAGSHGNTVGGMFADLTTAISGNAGNGVELTGGSSGNLIQGSEIGLSADGLTAVTNGANGVLILNSPGNTVGGTVNVDFGKGNLISGNQNDGILIDGSGSSGNSIVGNLIGEAGNDAMGNSRGNGGDGVEILGAANNTIGGASDIVFSNGLGNTLTGNKVGVLIHGQGASGNVIQGNVIGAATVSSTLSGNSGPGVEIDGVSGNLIGGMIPASSTSGVSNLATNLISGNGAEGLLLNLGATANSVEGNLIGTDFDGVSLVQNMGAGIRVQDSPGNTIGGTSALAQNTIVGQLGNALEIDGDASSGNLAEGNQIGFGAASAGQSSSMAPNNIGVLINGAPDNTIGGMVAGAGNIITNNGTGVEVLDDASVCNVIEGNLIGVDSTGLLVEANTAFGIDIIGGSGTTIGGLAEAARNVISGNGQINVAIDASSNNTSGNLIEGNYIGTDARGMATLTVLNYVGVQILDSPGNAVLDNVISGNAGTGLAIAGQASTGTIIHGNDIGTDPTGTIAAPNTGDGLLIANDPGVVIGGTDPGDVNVISGNGQNGLDITNGSTGVVVLNNLIGVDSSGSKELPNGVVGVSINSSPDVTIGGTVSGSANVISGNAGNQVFIQGVKSRGAVVLGNLIGTDSSGELPLLSNGVGVFIYNVSGVTIGGTALGAYNVISSNDKSGIEIFASGSSGNVVDGNLIGLDRSGKADLPNGGDGVLIEGGTANTIGGTAAGARNIISGNVLSGVEIAGLGAAYNLVLGNLIGVAVDYLTPTGESPAFFGNQTDGVIIDGDAGTLGNTIGGTAAGAANVITGNFSDGVEIDNEAATLRTGDVIIGNIIGLDTSTGKSNGPLNDLSGVVIVASSGIRVGGSTIAERNMISGNLRSGIQMEFAKGNLIEGNNIGSDVSGLIDYGNSSDGILDLNGSGNTIGGSAAGQGNLIFGNGGSGVALNTSTGDVIQGNTIGLNAAGSLYSTIPNADGTLHSLGNNNDGVSINAGGGNTIGGTVAGQGNVISGNFKNGITVVNAGNNNLIEGNNVGLDPTGLNGRGNRLNGIYITSSGNTVGGSVAGAGNIVSGNLNSGVVLSTITASRNLVEGNLIGTNVLGGDNPGGADPSVGADGIPIGNRQDGVFVNDDAALNTIGGTSAGARNVISGNGSDGIQILDINVQADPTLSDLPGNVVAGNFIGTDLNGSITDGNASAGVFVYNARNNTIGLSAAGGGNLISGNLGSGIAIQGDAATGNVVLANMIGTDASGGMGLPNAGDGVTIVQAANNRVGGLGTGQGNTILHNGGAGVSISSESNSAVVAGNVISGNGGDGVSVASSSNNPVIVGNRIGTDPTGEVALGNGLDGVRLTNAGVGSLVASNVIAANLGAGVEVTGFSSTAVVQANLIGLDALGQTALGNAIGVLINGVPSVVVGSLVPGLGNVISGNSVGVQVTANANTSLGLGDLIAGNVIGLDASGTKSLGNFYGIFLNDAVGVTIGGTTPGARNVISGNLGAGVQVFRVSLGGSGNLIEGNTIGLNASGMAVPTGAVQPIGIFLNSAANNTIGGTVPGSGNLISGNTTGNTATSSYGISIFGQSGGLSLNTLVEGNLIGTNALGGLLPTVNGTPVQTIGVVINTSAGNVIGGLAPSARNGIEGNVVGVEVVGLVEKFPGQPTGNLIVGDTIDANVFGVYLNEAQGNSVLDDELRGTPPSACRSSAVWPPATRQWTT